MSSFSLQAQQKDDRQTIERVYDLLQIREAGPAEVALLTPRINWAEVRSSKELNERYNISFSSIMQNNWQGLQFRDLVLKNGENNQIFATGTVTGRQPTECGIITSEFSHSWSLEDGEIIGFSE